MNWFNQHMWLTIAVVYLLVGIPFARLFLKISPPAKESRWICFIVGDILWFIFVAIWAFRGLNKEIAYMKGEQ